MADTRRSLAALQALLADNTSGDISAQDGRDGLVSMHPTNTVQADTVANLPAADQLTGDLYLPTNGVYGYRYSGSAWQAWGPLWPMTPPVEGDFSWVNEGGATLTTTTGGSRLVIPADGSLNVRARVKTAPAVPYTITLAVLPTFFNAQYYVLGPVFRQSSDGKLIQFGIGYESAANLFYEFLGYRMNSPTSFATQFTSLRFTVPLAPLWMRIADDNANRIFSISPNGVDFLPVFSEGRTSFLTADQVGYGAYVQNASLGALLHVLHWGEA